MELSLRVHAELAGGAGSPGRARNQGVHSMSSLMGCLVNPGVDVSRLTGCGLGLLSQSARAAVTKPRRPAASEQHRLVSHGSGGWRPETRVLARLGQGLLPGLRSQLHSRCIFTWGRGPGAPGVSSRGY